jgi:addiction module HigA family antidote
MTVQTPHPGVVLASQYMAPRGISQNQLARALGVSPRRINLLVHGQRSVTAETALMLSKYFGTTAEMWIDMQGRYDLANAKDRMHDRLEQIPASTSAAMVAGDRAGQA